MLAVFEGARKYRVTAGYRLKKPLIGVPYSSLRAKAYAGLGASVSSVSLLLVEVYDSVSVPIRMWVPIGSMLFHILISFTGVILRGCLVLRSFVL